MTSRREWGRQKAKKAFRKLDRLVQERGRGTVSRLETSLGYERGWWKNHRKPTHFMSLPNILAVLRELDEAPGEFFGDLDDDDECRAGHFLQQSYELSILEGLKEKILLGAKAHRSLALEIHQLDEHRYVDPAAALHRLLAMEDLPVLDIPLYLGVMGSCARMMFGYSEAEELLAFGAAASKHLNDRRALGDILQRRVYLALSRDDQRQALEDAIEAGAVFSHLKDLKKLGESVVDQAKVHFEMGRYGEALFLYKASLKYEDHLSYRYLFAARQGIAASLIALDRRREAYPWLEEARRTLHKLDNHLFEGKFLWACGQATELSERAVQLYVEAAERLLTISPIDATLAVLEVSGRLLGAGESALASSLVDRYIPKVTSLLTGIKAARHKLENVLSAARLQRLEVRLIDAARLALQKSLERKLRSKLRKLL